MRIYLDHNATTPLRCEVVDAMTAVLRDGFGNPSSTHAEGAAARARVDEARDQVAGCLGATSDQVVFAAGATEANNTVLSTLLAGDLARHHVVTTETEHPSVREPVQALADRGLAVTHVPVDRDGRLDPNQVLAAVTDATTLVSVIWANNETGAIAPVDVLAPALAERGIPFHVDATQAIGKWPVDVRNTPLDWLSCSAHKLNGPKGVGCLFARDPGQLRPLMQGGPQERGTRGGTENTAGIAGFGAACALATQELDQRMAHYRELRDRLWEGIQAKVEGVRWNGAAETTLPNTLNVEFVDTPGDVLLQALDLEGVAASAGAACHSGSISPSHVLVAMGRSPKEALASLRLSVGHGVDEAQIDRVIALLAELVPRVRGVSGS